MFTLSILISLFCSFLPETELTPVKKPVFYDLEHALDHFLEYVKTYDKVYERGEAATRYQNFVDTLVRINERNIKDPGTHGINIFADISEEEFATTMFGVSLPLNTTNYAPVELPEAGFVTPEEIDWRDKNAVTDVKNQGGCGSCWAFSAVAVIESQYAIKNQNLQQFSEQQVLDCDHSGTCNGGDPAHAFQSVQSAGGLESETDYAYTGQQGQCNFQADKVVVQVTDPQVYSMSEQDMTTKVGNYGPISVLICASSLNTYTAGSIWSPTDCPTDMANCLTAQNKGAMHAVTIVGYGYKPSPYWLIKNSWGKNWGDNGYFKMQRAAGLCFITSHVSLVSVV